MKQEIEAALISGLTHLFKSYLMMHGSTGSKDYGSEVSENLINLTAFVTANNVSEGEMRKAVYEAHENFSGYERIENYGISGSVVSASCNYIASRSSCSTGWQGKAERRMTETLRSFKNGENLTPKTPDDDYLSGAWIGGTLNIGNKRK